MQERRMEAETLHRNLRLYGTIDVYMWLDRIKHFNSISFQKPHQPK